MNEVVCNSLIFFFFFNDTATTEIYTLSLHDALPILEAVELPVQASANDCEVAIVVAAALSGREHGDTSAINADEAVLDRKSTRLNSSHANISYAVFCLKKKKIH